MGVKFTLRPNLAFSYIGSVSARYSSRGRQSNFAPLSRGRHLYSAVRPSRWVSAHILVKYMRYPLLKAAGDLEHFETVTYECDSTQKSDHLYNYEIEIKCFES